MAITEIDGSRQLQDLTLTRGKLVADFLAGSNLDLTGGNNDATLSGLAAGSAANDAVNKAQMEAAISSALAGGVNYLGGYDASGLDTQLDNASKGDMYLITVSGTAFGISFTAGDHLIVNKDVTGTPVTADIDKVDNTEASDILRTGSIVNDLTTGGTTVPLSAEQGKVLKGLADGLQTQFDERVFNEKKAVTNGSPIIPALNNIPVTSGTLRVHINGMLAEEGAGNDYQVNYTTGVITFEYNMKTKDKVICHYEY